MRIFNYPCEGASIGYMRCYTDHMNYINNCTLSYDRKYLVTSSDMDRCMMVWRVIKTEAIKEGDEDEEEEEHGIEEKNEKLAESP